jgi:hypothetical protein
MKNIKNLISTIISEASLDSRIPNGIVDLKNTDHIQVVAEAMYDACEDENIVNEFVESFVREGKYPDRQAYNKDGWLVTFPSAQYKQTAIKKGTHYPSDPTHGKGGMNLYYKKRGKQKRQTQQTASTTEPIEPVSKPKVAAPSSPETVPQSTQTHYSKKSKDSSTKPGEITPEMMGDDGEPAAKTAPSTSADGANFKEPVPTEQPKSEKPTTPSEPAKPAPAAPAAPASPAAPSYTALSVKFSASKGWKATPYGEYRDETGATVAVVGLSGEVVPIKNVDREEFKIFAEKNPM